MKKSLITLGICGLLFLNLSCTNDDSSPILPPTKLELLHGKWIIQEEGDIVNGKKENYLLEGCRTKDNYEFNKDLTFTYQFHIDKEENNCDTYADSGIYTLKNDQLELIFKDPTNPESIDIQVIKITETELHLQETASFSGKDSYYINLTRVP